MLIIFALAAFALIAVFAIVVVVPIMIVGSVVRSRCRPSTAVSIQATDPDSAFVDIINREWP